MPSKSTWDSTYQALEDAIELENYFYNEIMRIHRIADKSCKDVHVMTWFKFIYIFIYNCFVLLFVASKFFGKWIHWRTGHLNCSIDQTIHYLEECWKRRIWRIYGRSGSIRRQACIGNSLRENLAPVRSTLGNSILFVQ